MAGGSDPTSSRIERTNQSRQRLAQVTGVVIQSLDDKGTQETAGKETSLSLLILHSRWVRCDEPPGSLQAVLAPARGNSFKAIVASSLWRVILCESYDS